MRTLGSMVAVAAFALFAGAAGSAQTLTAVPALEASASDAAILLHCTRTGGAVVTRVPEFNTNGGKPLVLAHPRNFCEYTAKDGSQIAVLGSTLVATAPSLAVLAYYAKVQPGSCQGNPASCYCSLLGGTDLFGGINANGGGWVNKKAQNQVLDACIFPDESSIDSFGLFYHSAGIIRGIDLSKVLRYRG